MVGTTPQEPIIVQQLRAKGFKILSLVHRYICRRKGIRIEIYTNYYTIFLRAITGGYYESTSGTTFEDLPAVIDECIPSDVIKLNEKRKFEEVPELTETEYAAFNCVSQQWWPINMVGLFKNTISQDNLQIKGADIGFILNTASRVSFSRFMIHHSCRYIFSDGSYWMPLLRTGKYVSNGYKLTRIWKNDHLTIFDRKLIRHAINLWLKKRGLSTREWNDSQSS